MKGRYLGICCVAISLLLHGLVALAALVRPAAFSAQPAVIYEVVLATGPASAGSSPPARPVKAGAGLAAGKPSRPEQSAQVTQEKQTVAVPPPPHPVEPAAASASSPLPAASLPAVATAVGGLSGSSTHDAGMGGGPAEQDGRADGTGGPPLQLGSSGAPSFGRRVAPVYPALARRLGREGTVVLKLAIDAEGRLQTVEVVQAASFGFTEAALTAIRQSSYRPALRSGRPVQAQALVTIRFTLRS